MRLIDADLLATILDPLDLVEALRRGHAAGSEIEVERMFVAQRDTPNTMLSWGGWRRREGICVKTAVVFPDNPSAGQPAIRSVVLLFDGADGSPLAAIHGEAFTRMKTAADSALAASLLAREDARSLVLIGAGAQAETHLRFMLAVRPTIRRVTICNRTAIRSQALAASLDLAGVEVATNTDIAAAVADADILSCLTAALRPVFEGRWLKLGAHVDLVGGYRPDMREADDAAIRRSLLFADTRRFTLETCGDFTQAIASGVMSPGDLRADLFELAGDPALGRSSSSEITLFKNGGGGHLDLMAARFFHDHATATRSFDGMGADGCSKA